MVNSVFKAVKAAALLLNLLQEGKKKNLYISIFLRE